MQRSSSNEMKYKEVNRSVSTGSRWFHGGSGGFRALKNDTNSARVYGKGLPRFTWFTERLN